MKFNCKKINLKEAISQVERIVSKQPSLPILSNILIKTQKGRLLIASTNLEIAIETYIGAKIEKEGEITVPAKMLNGFLSGVKDEIIKGELVDNDLKITTQNHSMKIRGMDANDYPIIPEFPSEHFFELKTEDLINTIPIVLSSVAHNDTRQELNGIYMEMSEDQIILASTDSCRLSEAAVRLDKSKNSEEFKAFLGSNNSVIAPSIAFSELQRVLTGDSFKVVISQNQLFLKSNTVKIISRLINGNYPDYKQILPEKYSIELVLNKEEFLSALKIALLVSSDGDGEVILKKESNKKESKEDTLEILSQSSEAGENKSALKMESKGDDFEVVFNCRFLIDGLNVVKSFNENIVLKLNQQKSPALIRGFNKNNKENPDYSYIVMPIVKD
ncbi:MAG: DNA polymerase III subunit beta [Patescibacteria group bacterium]